MTKALVSRIDSLETICRTAQAQKQRRLRILVRDAGAQIGAGKATCQRRHQPGGSLFEIIDFYGCSMGEGPASAEEEAFAAWIEMVPIDGVLREFSGCDDSLEREGAAERRSPHEDVATVQTD